MDTRDLIMIIEASIFPFFMLIMILWTWFLGISRALKLPNGGVFLKLFIVKTLVIGVGVGVLLGSYFASTTLPAYATPSQIFGLILGGGGTVVLAGFYLFSTTKKALKLYKESDAYVANTTNSNVLDDSTLHDGF